MRILFLLFFYCLFLVASCSSQIGKAQINEIFVGKNGEASSENWVEIKLVDSSVDFSKWSVQLSQTSKINSTITVAFDMLKTDNYLVSIIPIKISRNANEQTNITLFDENNNTIDTITIYGNGGKASYMPQNQTCSQFTTANSSVSPYKVTTSWSFDVIERLGDDEIWVSWKDDDSKGSLNTTVNDNGSDSGYTITMYNTASKKLRTVVAGSGFGVTIETSKDIVDSNRILVVGSSDGCGSQNINLSCSQANLLSGALTAAITCQAPDEYHEKVWLKLYDGRNSFCSDDTFSIRPASFTVEAPSKLLTGENSIKIKAVSSNGAVTSNFTQSVDVNGSTLITSCPNPNPFNQQVVLTNGIGNIAIDDVGDINITVVSTVTNDECVADSSQNSSDINGLVGCNASGSWTVTPLPYEFIVSDLNLAPQMGLTRTYLYADDLQNMSARAGYKISAKSKNGGTTKNYSAGCYEMPIKMTPAITLAKLPAIFENPFSDFLLAGFHDGVLDINQTDAKAIRFNFTKPTVAIEPFDVNQTQLNLIVTDSNNTTSYMETSIASSVTFVYGRATITKTPENSLYLSAEIFSKSSLGDSYARSTTGGDFWVNSDDSISTFSPISSNQTIKSSKQSTSLVNGSASIELSNQSSSYQKSQIMLITSPWLLSLNSSGEPTCQNHPCESVEFFQPVVSAIWSGKGQKSIGAMPYGARKRSLD